jgi:hypothetical protein
MVLPQPQRASTAKEHGNYELVDGMRIAAFTANCCSRENSHGRQVRLLRGTSGKHGLSELVLDDILPFLTRK